MEYVITSEQLDKVLRPYFDKYFSDSKFGTSKNEDGDTWSGYWIKRGENYDLLVGHPYLDDSGSWFYNGQILEGELYYGIDVSDYIASMKRYLQTVLGQKVENLY